MQEFHVRWGETFTINAEMFPITTTAQSIVDNIEKLETAQGTISRRNKQISRLKQDNRVLKEKLQDIEDDKLEKAGFLIKRSNLVGRT